MLIATSRPNASAQATASPADWNQVATRPPASNGQGEAASSATDMIMRSRSGSPLSFTSATIAVALRK
jgi:hypothetical protein